MIEEPEEPTLTFKWMKMKDSGSVYPSLKGRLGYEDCFFRLYQLWRDTEGNERWRPVPIMDDYETARAQAGR